MRTGRRTHPARRRGRRAANGFTYLALLLAVAAMGVALAAVGSLWSTQARREREAELLFVGAQYRRAIAAYYQGTPAGARRYPQALEELLEDRRQPVSRRHLRRLYRDPMTNSGEWGLVREPDGGIRGVFSLAPGQPVRTGNFRGAERGFTDKPSYADWVFAYAPGRTGAAGPAAAASAPVPGASGR